LQNSLGKGVIGGKYYWGSVWIMIENEHSEKAEAMWQEFKEEILYKNRFIVKHEVLSYLEQFVNKNNSLIEKDTVLYRARIYKEDSLPFNWRYGISSLDVRKPLHKWLKESTIQKLKTNPELGFWGYDEQNSFIRNDNIEDYEGRTNPSFIKYLYTAEDPYTALVEVRPYLGSLVSVAEIRVDEDLKIADFSYKSIKNFGGFERSLFFMIMNDFSKPSDSDKKDYIPIQYIAEYIKNLGFDGIKFNSSLYDRGRNITVFKYQNCHAIGSKLYAISDICFDTEGLAPKDATALFHRKLEPYRNIDFVKQGLHTHIEVKDNFIPSTGPYNESENKEDE
jgi:hypothetical protein